MSGGTGRRGAGPGVVLGLVGHDIHVVASRILVIGLAENGFRPYDLGTNNDAGDFADAVLETGARAVLVASVNGEGEESCAGFGRCFARRGLTGIPRYIGGNLVIGERPPEEVVRVFTGYGFHRVFHRPPGFRAVFDALRRDLAGVPAE
ncbi:methylaspartate mutase subunit S [Streptomyces sp. F63]|uniref:methylaspartate mutase subunit S n=1 Tax=Streptomyces sp. F63 TaxID=2824887 RepID=UPI001B372CFC|nr:methylaspartate mutase subunit S [Streptomyces sp. F63]MBQ0984732.1 methylaspartate mutase subunit S [Streptomyces sp. F63]